MENIMENNVVSMYGVIDSGFTFNHEVFGEKFYVVDLRVSRLSDREDVLVLMVSERLIDVNMDMIGVKIQVTGQFRSYNRIEGEKHHLVLTVFARDIFFPEDEAETDPAVNNSIFLDGFICKEPIYRKTPLGREIADTLIAVNRPYGKSDYIPCITWGRNARFSSGLQVGERIRVWGRIQSREYMKRLNENESKKRVAYEVSVGKIETVR